jgi:hypothetical protein
MQDEEQEDDPAKDLVGGFEMWESLVKNWTGE